MPRFDGTGPSGLGKMTGRGAGYCKELNLNQRGAYGVNLGRGLGCRRGNRFMYKSNGISKWVNYVEEVPFYEERYLKNQAQLLENQLKQIKNQLKNLNENNEDNSDEVDSL